jgi:hypothetical protein
MKNRDLEKIEKFRNLVVKAFESGDYEKTLKRVGL